MTKLLASLALALIPYVASASNDTSATLLGPSTIIPSTTNSTSSSTTTPVADTGTSTTLQPAGLSPIQSTTGDSTGLTASNAQTLQAPITNDQALRVIMADADGTPQNLENTETQTWAWVLASMSLLPLGAGFVYLLRRRLTRH